MYFATCRSIEELKTEFKRLVRMYHPDLNPDTDTTPIMAAINAEYDMMAARLKNIHTTADAHHTTADETTTDSTSADETPEEFRAAVIAAVVLDGVTLEIVGRWLWATGDTYQHRDALKAAGYKWASKKRAWYWHTDEDACTGSPRRKEKTLDAIRTKYGAQRVGYTGRAASLTAGGC